MCASAFTLRFARAQTTPTSACPPRHQHELQWTGGPPADAHSFGYPAYHPSLWPVNGAQRGERERPPGKEAIKNVLANLSARSAQTSRAARAARAGTASATDRWADGRVDRWTGARPDRRERRNERTEWAQIQFTPIHLLGGAVKCSPM